MLLPKSNIDDRIWFGIVINNKSGNGQAEKICFDKLFPKLNNLNYKYDIIYNLTENIRDYDCIIIVGGDGTIVPVIQYLCNNNINIPLCYIPAGSGNGLSKSILFDRNMEFSLDNACSLLEQPNIMLEQTNKFANLLEVNKKLYCFLSITWGIISDLDYKTEWLRYLGSYRFNIGAVFSLLKKKSYDGCLETMTEDGKWEVVEGKFIYFIASNTTHISHNTYTMPLSKIDDGYIHITYLLEPVSRYNLYKVLTSLETGEHLQNLTYIKTKYFRLKPKEGILMIDGEVQTLQDIEVKISDKRLNLI